MATINITDLRLHTFIGTNDWEQETKQEILINITIEFDATEAAKSDNIADTVDYQAIQEKIIVFVENAKFNLLETFSDRILDIIMKNTKVLAASIKIDKPKALRLAKSVSLEVARRK